MLRETEELHRARVQSLRGIDEMIEDIVAGLDEEDLLKDTYIMYTSDNGYMIGTHRIPAVKSLAYKEAGQTPFVVRGPNVPQNAISKLPGTHTDLAPTLLEIAGVNHTDFPAMFDGRSLFFQWPQLGGGNGSNLEKPKCAKDLIGVEFWGDADIELPMLPPGSAMSYTRVLTTFKALRVVGEDQAYLYIVWCTGELELYNTNVGHNISLSWISAFFRANFNSSRMIPTSLLTLLLTLMRRLADSCLDLTLSSWC